MDEHDFAQRPAGRALGFDQYLNIRLSGKETALDGRKGVREGAGPVVRRDGLQMGIAKQRGERRRRVPE